MLTVKQIESSKPKDKAYRLTDGEGLFLFIPPTGKKVWRMRYRFDGKEKTLVIGPYPEISLADARAKRFEAKVKLSNGFDPSEQKQTAKKQEKLSENESFSDIFHEWYSNKYKTWSLRYSEEMKEMFDKDILPVIGHMRMEEIEPMIMLKVIRLFENRGAMERADKARRRCGEVFRYAIVTGRAKYNPAPDLVDAMRGYRKSNYPFLPMGEIHQFNRDLASYSGSIITKIATQVLQYTALRTVELRSIEWDKVDFETNIISIDPSIMKGRRIHIVPMSRQVIALLQYLNPITGNHKFVFIGRSNQNEPISDGAILGVIRRIGYAGRTCGHGFRHQFSTVLNEKHWNSDAIEAQLAHVNSEGTRGIYNHAQYLEKRREMMQWWADWIDELIK